MAYRLQELEIPEDQPFKNDALARQPIVEFLSGLVSRLCGPFVLALDSPWGTGKTTLIRMLQADLKQKNFQCVYFNAWQVDYVTDPLVALVSSIDEIRLEDTEAASKFRGHLKIARNITSAVAKRGAIAVAKAATFGALDLEKEIEVVVAEVTGNLAGDAIDAFQKEKALLEKFRQELERAVAQLKEAGKNESLIFFIDELDRCRPTFAIEMLERIKHLFDVSNIIFVLSIDKAQLEASTASVYGEKIDAPEYLRRFIDLEYGIPVVQTKQFTTNLLTRFGLDPIFLLRTGSEVRYDKENFVDFFTAIADVFRLSLRARERCITRLVVVLDQTPSNNYLDPVLVAFLLILRSKQPDLFHALCNGTTNPADAMQSLSKLPGGQKLVADQFGIVIETYLLAGDTDSARTEARYKELVEIAQNSTENQGEKNRAGELIDMRRHVPGAGQRRFKLSNIAAKIDFASMVKD